MMEVKVKKVIEMKNQCAKYLKSIDLFQQTDADKMSMTKDQVEDLAGILRNHKELLEMMIDSASIYI